jgi:hypothetical protein
MTKRFSKLVLIWVTIAAITACSTDDGITISFYSHVTFLENNYYKPFPSR